MKVTCICVAGPPGQSETSANVSGDVITVGGVSFDLSDVPDGGFAEPEGESHPFIGRIERINGELHVQLRWFFFEATAEPHQPAVPPAFMVIIGAVPDPIVRKPLISEVEA
ncbi:hypothetical protein ETW23_00500 [Leisingera sp. NJS201]|uniref:hypothetical protein n=1 Tax=Leisingera sp. NJS201 TaxID=2508306 RepID=UPI0010708201|nr:hypothetical protein [Leisingera sp. NJS201]QBR34877.1 hypothetical protein ETW23_00500 [Leisingera sp. NJS201]